MRVSRIAVVLECDVARMRQYVFAVLRFYLLASFRHSVCAAITAQWNAALPDCRIAAISEAPRMRFATEFGGMWRGCAGARAPFLHLRLTFSVLDIG